MYTVLYSDRDTPQLIQELREGILRAEEGEKGQQEQRQ